MFTTVGTCAVKTEGVISTLIGMTHCQSTCPGVEIIITVHCECHMLLPGGQDWQRFWYLRLRWSVKHIQLTQSWMELMME